MKDVKCNLCGSSHFISLFVNRKKFEVKILKCLKCNLIFIYPQTIKNKLRSYYQDKIVIRNYDLKRFRKRLNRLNSSLGRLILKECYGYNKISVNKISIFKKLMAFTLKNFFIKNIIPFKGEGRILDIGCGSGLYLALLKNIGWDTYGVEVNKYACEYAKNLGINIFCGELEEANFPSNYFDVIRIVHVLEHLPFPLQSFMEIRRILKPNGIIYLEIPNQRSFAFKCFKERWLSVDGHLYAFSPFTLNFLCKKVGLYIKKIKFKSSKGIILDSLGYLWKDIFSLPFPTSILRNKAFHFFVVNPLRFFLNQIHWADTLVAEIVK